ncbi:MAG: HD domain-containing phosphohydrolase [Thermoleophilia bacterium]
MDKKETRILVVDDESAIREVLTRTLEDEGYVCESADCVDAALEKNTSAPADLILTDIMMPGRTGIQLLQEIKNFFPDTAVIIVTAVADTDTAIKAMRMGAYDYVTKPFNLVEVLMSVDRALDKRSLLLDNREYRNHLERKVEEQTEEIRNTYVGAVKSLAQALEAKDPYTNGHSIRVTEVTVTLAQELGLDHEMLEQVRLAGLVHDIGKIGVPEVVLHKSGKLTDEEFEFIKSHPAAGEKILSPVIKDKTVLGMVRHHHERFGGGGYPGGLVGEDIPLGARLMAVSDAYDAMTSTRPYRGAMTPEKARAQLLSNRGSQFDPELVDLFIRVEDKMPYCPITAAPDAGKVDKK